jgi:DNA-directed RNA polymerase specialized sigma24 family protein
VAKYKYSPEKLQQIESNRWLTDRERSVFELYYRRGWAIEDVAAELDVCRTTVNNDLKSIRAKSI